MIVDKYLYPSLDRVNHQGIRYYLDPKGRHLPSVTTILDRTKTEESKQALQSWRNRIGAERAQSITVEAANRGTRMHKYLETYVKTGVMMEKGSNPFSWASYAMAQTVIEQGLARVDEVWGVEVPLYFPEIYAGTTDCVGLHDGIPSILDFKQSNRPKREEWIQDYKLQLAAYATAHNEIHGTDINKGVILMCVKPGESAPGEFDSRPQYQQWIIQGDEFKYWVQQWWKRVEEYYIKCA